MTWLKEDHSWKINIQGYAFYQKGRQLAKGGEALLLVKKEMKSLGEIGSQDVESLWVKLLQETARAKRS